MFRLSRVPVLGWVAVAAVLTVVIAFPAVPWLAGLSEKYRAGVVAYAAIMGTLATVAAAVAAFGAARSGENAAQHAEAAADAAGRSLSMLNPVSPSWTTETRVVGDDAVVDLEFFGDVSHDLHDFTIRVTFVPDLADLTVQRRVPRFSLEATPEGPDMVPQHVVSEFMRVPLSRLPVIATAQKAVGLMLEATESKYGATVRWVCSDELLLGLQGDPSGQATKVPVIRREIGGSWQTVEAYRRQDPTYRPS
jgi:hypothetical protein